MSLENLSWEFLTRLGTNRFTAIGDGYKLEILEEEGLYYPCTD